MIFINYQELREEYVNLVVDIELLSIQYGLSYTETIRQAKFPERSNVIYINRTAWNELAIDFDMVEDDMRDYAREYGIGIDVLRERLAKTDINSLGTTLTSAINQAIKEESEKTA